jgi:hypothetical protein
VIDSLFVPTTAYLGSIVLAVSLNRVLTAMRAVSYGVSSDNMGNHIVRGYVISQAMTRIGIALLTISFVKQVVDIVASR